MNSGRILYSQAPDAARGPASLTKMMTLYVLFSYLRAGSVTLDSELVVTPHAASQSPTKLGLKPGATITVADAIKGLVTQSANDAAVTVAENIGGTEDNFARMMTQKARSLGMSGTVFHNASGLPDPQQVTTARDMAILAEHLMRDFPEYYPVFETRYFTYQGHRYRNHNHLLFTYKGTDGVKTGYTLASGFNLTASVHRDNKHLIAVVLGGRTGAQRDAAMRALLDRYFPDASTTPSPTKAPLIASAEPAAPVQPVQADAPVPIPVTTKVVTLKKPILAGMAVPAASSAPVAPAPAVQPASYGSQPQSLGEADSDGDERVEAAQPKVAAMPSDPIITGHKGVMGSFHVQVGAFASEADAEARLNEVQQRAARAVKGHQPFTTSFTKDDSEWYRARFAGFSQNDAKTTCEALRRMLLDCVVMRAE